MFKTIKNAWSIPDLRKKILFTLLIVVVFRLGAVIPVPFLNTDALEALMANVSQGGTALSYLDMLTGGAFSNATLFAMGVSPYINSSIIMQLLTVAIPPLERMAKEGEEGRKKIATITRYVTVLLGLIQGTAYYFYLRNTTVAMTDGTVKTIAMYTSGWEQVFTAIIIIMVFTAGTALMMWLGEQINDKGIGNGISILLFAGIVSRLPTTLNTLYAYWSQAMQAPSEYGQYFFFAPFFIVLFLAVIWVIVFMNNSERRIPVQYAKRVVGRKMYGGQSSTLPMKVNMSGVLPIIFAQSIAMIIPTVAAFLPAPEEGTFGYTLVNAVDSKSVLYMIVYFLMIIAFSYFYATIQFNPVEISNNLKKNGGFIPGFRPGKPTADFIKKVLNKVTLFGAIYLGIVAILPLLIGKIVNVAALSIGGTSVIIVVGVALETVQALESQMLMRQYKGFLE